LIQKIKACRDDKPLYDFWIGRTGSRRLTQRNPPPSIVMHFHWCKYRNEFEIDKWKSKLNFKFNKQLFGCVK